MNITNRAAISSFVVTSIILAVTGYLGTTLLHKKISAVEEISNELDSVARLNLTLHEAISYLNNYLITGDPDEAARYKKASAEVKQLFENIIALESKSGRLDVALENAVSLYSNIDRMSEDLFKYEVPLDSKDAIVLMLEIQQTADWISRLYIHVHELKDKGKLEKAIEEAESIRKWANWVQAACIAVVLILGLILYKKKVA